MLADQLVAFLYFFLLLFLASGGKFEVERLVRSPCRVFLILRGDGVEILVYLSTPRMAVVLSAGEISAQDKQ